MARERNLSFSEREGITSLPGAYELEDLSYEVRNEIKYILDEELKPLSEANFAMSSCFSSGRITEVRMVLHLSLVIVRSILHIFGVFYFITALFSIHKLFSISHLLTVE